MAIALLFPSGIALKGGCRHLADVRAHCILRNPRPRALMSVPRTRKALKATAEATQKASKTIENRWMYS